MQEMCFQLMFDALSAFSLLSVGLFQGLGVEFLTYLAPDQFLFVFSSKPEQLSLDN